MKLKTGSYDEACDISCVLFRYYICFCQADDLYVQVISLLFFTFVALSVFAFLALPLSSSFFFFIYPQVSLH